MYKSVINFNTVHFNGASFTDKSQFSFSLQPLLKSSVCLHLGSTLYNTPDCQYLYEFGMLEDCDLQYLTYIAYDMQGHNYNHTDCSFIQTPDLKV